VSTPDDGLEDDSERAVDALRALGLSEYQARAFVGLYRRRRGTAREVAEASGVPRARIYDTLNALHEEGLVDIQQSTPREYLAVSLRSLIDSRAERYHEREVAVHDALDAIEQTVDDPSPEENGVWVVVDRDRITSLERRFIGSASDRVIIGLATAEVLEEETVETLADVSERVEVVVEASDETATERFGDVPGVEVMEPARAWEDTPELEGQVGRILVVDDRHVLVSTVLETDGSTLDEAAVWTSGGGPGDGLALALREFMLGRVARRVQSDDE
jgi:sugar-specific transcriptional regulator TrmB